MSKEYLTDHPWEDCEEDSGCAHVEWNSKDPKTGAIYGERCVLSKTQHPPEREKNVDRSQNY